MPGQGIRMTCDGTEVLLQEPSPGGSEKNDGFSILLFFHCICSLIMLELSKGSVD